MTGVHKKAGGTSAAFPTAAAPGDAESNATAVTSRIGALLRSFNGTTWDRVRSGLVAAQSSAVGILNAVSMAVYNATPGAATDGFPVPLQGDSVGNLRVVEMFRPAAEDATNGVIATAYKPLAAATYCPSLFYIDSPSGAKGFIKASAGNLFGFHAINNNGSIRYLQFCNTTDGTMTGALSAQFAIAATSSQTITNAMLTAAGINLSVGISYGFSTTQGSFVAGTAGNHSLTLTYA